MELFLNVMASINCLESQLALRSHLSAGSMEQRYFIVHRLLLRRLLSGRYLKEPNNTGGKFRTRYLNCNEKPIYQRGLALKTDCMRIS